MAIQFGYVTMFACVAPWATTLCLLNNIIERKSDALKMLYESQRPRWQGAESIGAWYGIFEFLTFAAILTNMGLLALTSTALTDFYGVPITLITPPPSPIAHHSHPRPRPSGVDGWHLAGLIITLEHLLIILKLVVAARIPDTPLWVLKAQAYEAWLQKRGEAIASGHGASGLAGGHREDVELLRAELDDESDLETFWRM